MGDDQNDLLSFFSKQDKLKTKPKKPAAPVQQQQQQPPPKKEEPVPEPKVVVEQKPGKVVQDLRALREAKEKTEELEAADSPVEEKKSFAWASNTPQPKSTKSKSTKSTQHKPTETKKQQQQQASFPTFKQAMSGEAYQLNHALPTLATPAPPPLSNAFTGLEDELSSSDDEEEEKKEEKKEKKKKPEKKEEKSEEASATTEKPKEQQAKKSAEPKKQNPTTEKPKKGKSKDEEDVAKLMADMGLVDKKAGGKKKGKK